METLAPLVASPACPPGASRSPSCSARSPSASASRLMTDGRLPHLARRRAAADPLAHGDDRRRPLLRPRPAARALPRAARLARPRAPVARPDPLALLRAHRAAGAGTARGLPARRPPRRMVGDVDALQGLYLRGLGPPLVALAVGASPASAAPPCSCPPPRRSSPAGSCSAASRCRCRRLVAGRRAADARPRPRRADRRARRAPARRARARRLRPRGRGARPRPAADAELVRLGRRDALAAGARGRAHDPRRGPDRGGRLASPCRAHDAGTLDRVLVATLALLALASFDGGRPLPAAAASFATSPPAGASSS